MMTNPNSVDISLTAFNETFQAPWVGRLEAQDAGKWIDDFLVLVSGTDLSGLAELESVHGRHAHILTHNKCVDTAFPISLFF